MYKGIALIAALCLVLGFSTFVWAQGIDLQFDDQPLGSALRALQQAYGVQYNLPGDLANKRVTVHQTVNSVAAAVQALAAAAGVRAIPDPNTGTFIFRAAQAPGAPGATAAPPNPWAGTAPTAGGVGPVPPTRPGMPTIPPSMPSVGPGAAPGTPGATAGQPGMLTTPYGTVLDPKDLTLRVLELNYLNPELVAMLFGGFAVYDISSTGGGYGGGYGGGGYGSSGYGYGSSGYGYDTGRSSRSSRSRDTYSGSSYGYESGRSSRSYSSSRNY